MLVDHLFQGCVMATRVPPHEIGKVQGDSTNRNHLTSCLFYRLPIDQDNSSNKSRVVPHQTLEYSCILGVNCDISNGVNGGLSHGEKTYQ